MFNFFHVPKRLEYFILIFITLTDTVWHPTQIKLGFYNINLKKLENFLSKKKKKPIMFLTGSIINAACFQRIAFIKRGDWII